MKRLLAAVAFIIAAVLLSGHAALFAQNLQTATKPPWERGDAYLYGRFFAQVMQMNQQADEADRLGMNSTYLRTYFQVKAQLNSSETILLNQITAKLAAKLVQYDANAEKLRRDRHLAAQTARANNQPIPPLPAAIKQIPAGRDALILAAQSASFEFRRRRICAAQCLPKDARTLEAA